VDDQSDETPATARLPRCRDRPPDRPRCTARCSADRTSSVPGCWRRPSCGRRHGGGCSPTSGPAPGWRWLTNCARWPPLACSSRARSSAGAAPPSSGVLAWPRRTTTSTSPCRRASGAGSSPAWDSAAGRSPPTTTSCAGEPAWPVAQFEVRDVGGFAGRVDLAWPQHRLALEYEGTWHGAPQRVPEDRERLNRLFAAGWRVIFVTKTDLRRPERLLAAYAQPLPDRLSAECRLGAPM